MSDIGRVEMKTYDSIKSTLVVRKKFGEDDEYTVRRKGDTNQIQFISSIAELPHAIIKFCSKISLFHENLLKTLVFGLVHVS